MVSVVLLPGLNGTEGLFNPLLEFKPDGIETIVISYPTQEKKTYRELSYYILSELETITGSYVLLGESFSGPIALFVAQSNPNGLIGVILAASFISAPQTKLLKYLPWNFGFSLAKPIYGVRRLFSNRKHAILLRLISKEIEKVAPKVLSHRIQLIFAVKADRALINCKVPILYLRGKHDYIVPKKNLDKIVELKNNVEVTEFNTQHLVLQSAPEEAWAAISEFTYKNAIQGAAIDDKKQRLTPGNHRTPI